MNNQKTMDVTQKQWMQTLLSLNHQEYFSTITNPYSINHFDFFEAIASPESHKNGAEDQWLEVLHRLSSSNVVALQRAATQLRKVWKADKESGKVERFWRDVELDDTVSKDHVNLLKVGALVKRTFMSNRAGRLDHTSKDAYSVRAGKRKSTESATPISFPPPLTSLPDVGNTPFVPQDAVNSHEQDLSDSEGHPGEPDGKSTSQRQTSSPTARKKHKIGKPFSEKGRRSLDGRYNDLGKKWVLRSGTIVENILYFAGKDLNAYSPIHSFTLDIDDPWVEGLFAPDDWQEIISDLPTIAPYTKEASQYMDQFIDVETIQDLKESLRNQPDDVESEIVHYCLKEWLDLYRTTDPSPFSIVGQLGEAWWLTSAWGACRKSVLGVSGSFMITGEKTGHDSAARRNRDLGQLDRRKMGVRADLIWRTLIAPERDWAVAEAAPDWDPISDKYKFESAFKLPRQLHDILTARSAELGGPDQLRSEVVTGLIFGGPVIQRVILCWGTSGDNVTRLMKAHERRIQSSVKDLSESLLAIHELLLFRSSTVRLKTAFDHALRDLRKAKHQARRNELQAGPLKPRPKDRVAKLLHSSP